MGKESSVCLLVGDGRWLTHGDDQSRPVRVSDGPTGLRREIDDENTAVATCFPVTSTLAASWDRELLAEVGAAMGDEALSLGVDVLLAPGINIKRTPLCGRNFEYFSEDPLLTAELATGFVRGLQSRGVGASLKHFAANNQEHQRHFVSARVDERTLREIYLFAFERVVAAADPWSVMCSYNRLNGVHTSEDPWLLTEVLRKEWGYQGVVVSDWGAVHDPVAALIAGLDLQMPGDEGRSVAILASALAHGRITPELVEMAATRIRRLGTRCGQAKSLVEPAGEQLLAHESLARRAGAAGTVLVRNTGVLPLASGITRVLVVGRQGVQPTIQGGGSSEVRPRAVTNLVDELSAQLPGQVVEFVPGYDWEPLVEGVPDRIDPDCAQARALRLEAVGRAGDADLVIVCLGHPFGVECEGYDRPDADLPATQVALVESLISTGRPVVCTIASGSALVLGDWVDETAALLISGLGGAQGGAALADVLTGRLEPSGRLTESWPIRLADMPGQLTYPGERAEVCYGEGVLVGYRGLDAARTGVRYPFGFGLGYGNLVLTSADVEILDESAAVVRVIVRVWNAGDRASSGVVQVYVHEDDPVVIRPPWELRGFAKKIVEPGTSVELSVELTGRDFAFFDVISRSWQRHPGRFTIGVGTSSRDLPHRISIDLPADPNQPVFTDDEALGRLLQRYPDQEF